MLMACNARLDIWNIEVEEACLRDGRGSHLASIVMKIVTWKYKVPLHWWIFRGIWAYIVLIKLSSLLSNSFWGCLKHLRINKERKVKTYYFWEQGIMKLRSLMTVVVESTSFELTHNWVKIPILSLTSCVTFGKLLNFFQHQFPYL